MINTVRLIDAVNTVLESIGERKVTSFNSPVARKANQSVQEALVDIATSHDWDWLKDTILAISWLQDTAYIGDVQKVYAVSVGDSTIGTRLVPWVDKITYDVRPVTPMLATEVYPYSSYYTQPKYGYISVNPYPTTSSQQAFYRFSVLKDIIPPSDLLDKFPLPSRFMPLVYYRAGFSMAMNHLDDADSAQMFARQYDTLLMRLRDRERDIPQSSANMFRYRRY